MVVIAKAKQLRSSPRRTENMADNASKMQRREVLLRGLFSAFAEYSAKAATIFRELAEVDEPAPPKKKAKSSARSLQKLTGYQIFSHERRDEIKVSRPSATFVEISQEISATNQVQYHVSWHFQTVSLVQLQQPLAPGRRRAERLCFMEYGSGNPKKIRVKMSFGS